MTLDALQFRDRAVYLAESQTLVAADLHLGRGRVDGVAAPVDDAVDLVGRLEALVAHWSPERTVLAGDVLDSFCSIPPGVTERFELLLDRLSRPDHELVLVAGNHDTMLEHLFDGPVYEEFVVSDAVITHGHREPNGAGELVVIGHEHPALHIEGVKQACYLHAGNVYEGQDLLVLPSFSPLLRGTGVDHRRDPDCHSPLLHDGRLVKCRPIVLDVARDEPLVFPPLGSMRRLG